MRRFSLANLLGRLRAPGAAAGARSAPIRSGSLVERLEDRRLLAGRGLAGYYFTNPDFTQLAFKREDAQIDVDFSGGNPAAESATSGFGARWSGRVMPKFSELYRFYTRSTGGVRVWVDGQLIIDDWSVHPLKDNKGTINLKAGERYDLRIEYFDSASASQFQLHWASKRQAREVVPQNRMFASEFDTTAPTAPTKLRATYVTDSAFKFIWNPSADDSGTVVYDVYLGRTRLGGTTETYYTRGGRHPESPNSVHVRSVDFAGNVAFSEYLLIQTTAAPEDATGTGLAGAYYASRDFTQFRMTRTDPNLMLAWDGTPISGSTDVEFSARWEGKVLPRYDEFYTFYVVSDGAAKLWINDTLIVNRPDDGTMNEATGGLKLRAGRLYNLRVDYQHEPGSNAVVALMWSSLSTKKEAVPTSQLYPKFVDASAPVPPSNLRVDSVGERDVALRWDAATDDIGVTRYNVYRNGTYIGSTSDTRYGDSNLTPGTSYSYHVTAVDGASHASAPSNTLNVTTTSTPVIHDARDTMPAVNYADGSGVTRGNNAITSLDDGNWVVYRRMDFGSGGINSLQIKLGASVSGAGGVIEVRLGARDGQRIASHTVQPTGDYGTHYTQRVAVNAGISGVHDVYLIFKNADAVAEVESFRFSTQRLVRVMPLGDSITNGSSGYNSFRYYLYRKLIDEGFGVDFVGSRISNGSSSPPNFDFDQNHEGWSGMRIDQMVDNVANWVSAADPDIILLHMGTNDVWRGDSNESSVQEMGQLIDAIRAVKPSVRIVLAQIIPHVHYTAKIGELNGMFATLAADKNTSQSPIVVVDQYSGFSVDDDTHDGVHPNNGGASKMADRFYNALAPMLG